MALLATSLDIQSTILGITALGWGCSDGVLPGTTFQFCEANPFVRMLYPYLGVFATVAYWPFEAGFVAVMGLALYYCMRPVMRLLERRWTFKHPERATWFAYVACYSPLTAAVINTTIVALHAW